MRVDESKIVPVFKRSPKLLFLRSLGSPFVIFIVVRCPACYYPGISSQDTIIFLLISFARVPVGLARPVQAAPVGMRRRGRVPERRVVDPRGAERCLRVGERVEAAPEPLREPKRRQRRPARVARRPAVERHGRRERPEPVRAELAGAEAEPN